MRRPITEVAKEVNALEMQGIPLTFRKKQELLYDQDVLNGKISVEDAYKKLLSTKTVTSFLTEKPSAPLPDIQTLENPEQEPAENTAVEQNAEPPAENAVLDGPVQLKYGGSLPDLPKYQAGTSVFPKTTDKYGNTGTRVKLVSDIDQETGEAYAAYAPEYSLPEVTVTGSKHDITNSAALQRWSKENDPIAYAARKGMSEAAPYVASGLGFAFAPAGASLLGLGARGLATAGEVTYGALSPYVSAAWNASLPGMSSIPGATVGNAINAGFATHGATHIIPDTKKLIEDPSLEKGLNVGMDALEMLPMVGPTVKGGAEMLQTSKSAALKGRNFVAAKLLSNQLNKPLPKVQPKSSPIKRVDLIDKSTIGIKNDWAKALSESEYNQLLEDLYLANEYEYNNPLVSWKNLRPASFYQELGNSASPRVEGGLVDNTGWYDEGMYFKDKFCPPGSECAKTANATASKIYTDLTGKAFNTEANAHNAWHMEDQMTRHGGKLVEGFEDLKVGDRILMGNEVSQATEVPGYIADPSVRHAGTYIGLSKLGDTHYPVLLESGKNNPLYVNPLQNTFTGENTVKKVLRAAQFQGTETGKGLVEKNLRYAFRDAPSIASYSSENKVAQGILDKAGIHREKIKRIHDITNDEFDEIVNTLIGIGGQETKLQGSLPGSKLSKLKIQLQDELTNIGLTAPIKRTINLGKKAANTISKSSKQKAGLPEYPGTSKIEMEAAKLSASENISFKDAVAQIKAQYQDKPRFTLSTIEPSKGTFRQKFQTTTDLVEGIGQDIKGKNSVENAIGLMAENFKKIKKLYPDATPRELMDLTTLMWNSPGKAKNKELVDFFLFKKNNPDPSRFNFDYVRKVNELKNKLIDIQPKGERHPIFEFTRKGYPEIEYKTGGYLPKYQNGTPASTTSVSLPPLFKTEDLVAQDDYIKRVAVNQAAAKQFATENPSLVYKGSVPDTGKIDFPSTDRRSTNYVGNPNLAFAAGNTTGPSRKYMEDAFNTEVAAGLLFEGIPMAYRATKPIAKKAVNLSVNGFPKRNVLANKSKVQSPGINFNTYLSPEDAAAARAKRMLSQIETKTWNSKSPRTIKNFENVDSNLDLIEVADPSTLGTNSMDRAIVYTNSGIGDANISRIAAHEVGHFYRNMGKEAKEWNSFFDFSSLPHTTRRYLRGKTKAPYEHGSLKNTLFERADGYYHGDEIRERAAQLKDHIAFKNNIPLDKDFTVTMPQLNDAIKTYIKDTGLDNTMSPMLKSLRDKKGFLNAMNKYPLSVAGAGVGFKTLKNFKKSEQ